MLLLTPGVLTRPWCLVEIVTAVRENINLVPVDIVRDGIKFRYPDDVLYDEILAGRYLDDAALDLFKKEGIDLPEVVESIRKVFVKIAVTFSPHKHHKIRKVEIDSILARCHLRTSMRFTSNERADSRFTSSERSDLF